MFYSLGLFVEILLMRVTNFRKAVFWNSQILNFEFADFHSGNFFSPIKSGNFPMVNSCGKKPYKINDGILKRCFISA